MKKKVTSIRKATFSNCHTIVKGHLKLKGGKKIQFQKIFKPTLKTIRDIKSLVRKEECANYEINRANLRGTVIKMIEFNTPVRESVILGF